MSVDGTDARRDGGWSSGTNLNRSGSPNCPEWRFHIVVQQIPVFETSAAVARDGRCATMHAVEGAERDVKNHLTPMTGLMKDNSSLTQTVRAGISRTFEPPARSASTRCRENFCSVLNATKQVLPAEQCIRLNSRIQTPREDSHEKALPGAIPLKTADIYSMNAFDIAVDESSDALLTIDFDYLLGRLGQALEPYLLAHCNYLLDLNSP
ncbi:hypothetical protein ON010_g3120 [Phytophthora cinnamomi]|nr:hypothetical protein ON010_g3120 [Phytophthora cinnamomi]